MQSSRHYTTFSIDSLISPSRLHDERSPYPQTIHPHIYHHPMVYNDYVLLPSSFNSYMMDQHPIGPPRNITASPNECPDHQVLNRDVATQQGAVDLRCTTKSPVSSPQEPHRSSRSIPPPASIRDKQHHHFRGCVREEHDHDNMGSSSISEDIEYSLEDDQNQQLDMGQRSCKDLHRESRANDLHSPIIQATPEYGKS